MPFEGNKEIEGEFMAMPGEGLPPMSSFQWSYEDIVMPENEAAFDEPILPSIPSFSWWHEPAIQDTTQVEVVDNDMEVELDYGPLQAQASLNSLYQDASPLLSYFNPRTPNGPWLSDEVANDRQALIPKMQFAFNTKSNIEVVFAPMMISEGAYIRVFSTFFFKQLGAPGLFWDTLKPGVISSGIPPMAGNPSTCVSPYGFGGSGKLDKRSPYEEEVMKQNIVMEEVIVVVRRCLGHTKTLGYLNLPWNGSFILPYAPKDGFIFDICCKVHGVDDGPIWLKALNKTAWA